MALLQGRGMLQHPGVDLGMAEGFWTLQLSALSWHKALRWGSKLPWDPAQQGPLGLGREGQCCQAPSWASLEGEWETAGCSDIWSTLRAGLLAQNSRMLGEFGARSWGAQGCQSPEHTPGSESLAHELLGHQDLAPRCSWLQPAFWGQSTSTEHYLFCLAEHFLTEIFSWGALWPALAQSSCAQRENAELLLCKEICWNYLYN